MKRIRTIYDSWWGALLGFSHSVGGVASTIVLNVTSSTANGTYGLASVISIQVTFSGVVNVTGAPVLTLETGATNRDATYSAGSGTATLTFLYTVQAGDISGDLDYVDVNSLGLGGGTINDAAGNPAVLTLPTPGAAGSLGANKAIVIDTVAPICTISSSDTDPTIISPITFTFTWSKSVMNFVVGDITIGLGTKITFTTVTAALYTLTVFPNAGATVTADVNAAVCTDLFGNPNTAAVQYTVASKVLVWDDFTDVTAAGALNGTPAMPGPGTRTVTDTNSKLSTDGTYARFAAGGVGAGNPGMWYGGIVRGYGQVIGGQVIPTDTNSFVQVGTDENTSTSGTGALAFYTAALYAQLAASVGPIGAFTATTYLFSIVIRTSGAYYFIKGGAFTNWTLLYFDATRNTTPIYPTLGYYSVGSTAFTVDKFRAFKAGTYDVPLVAYDTFTQADGPLNGVNSDTTGPDGQTVTARTWTSSGGAISTNKLVITPTLGGEMWDADAAVFTAGTYAWVAYGTNTIANDANSLKITYVDNSAGAYNLFADAYDLNANLTVGTFYKFSFDSKVGAGDNVGILLSSNWMLANGPMINETQINFTSHSMVNQSYNATGCGVAMGLMAAGEDVWLDNLSCKPITFSSMIASLTDAATPSVVASANFILTTECAPAGFVLMNNAGSTSHILAYLINGAGTIYFCLCDNNGGTWTRRVGTSGGTPYSSGAPFTVTTQVSGTNILVRMFYNGVAQGGEITVADVAGNIRSNTVHGLLSGSSLNSITNFSLFARAGYTGLDSFIA